MRFIKILAVCIFMCSVLNVSAQTASDIKSKVTTLETKIIILETKVAILEENNRNLNQRIDQLLLQLQTNNPNLNLGTSSNVPQNNSTNTTPSNFSSPTTPSSSYGRCGATTKKGTQCSRSAKSNGYCWQHGGN